MSEIADIRNRMNLSRPEFAKALGIPLRTIQCWEHGDRRPPKYVIELIRFKAEAIMALIALQK